MSAPVKPQISVILPAYNAEAYIESAVRSILTQTFGDFEFIIINDGSTDGTEAILRRLADEDSRIRLISRSNTGFLAALKEAAAICQGEYIARMDADDLAAPKRFSMQVEFLDAHPEVTVVGTSYDLIDAAGRRLRTMRQPTDDAALQRDCLAGMTPICHPTAMFRRSAYEQAGGYDESFEPAEDLDLWLRLGETGQLACLPDVLLQYRLHANSISETKQQKQIDAAGRAVEAAGRRRGIAVHFKANAGWREIGPAGQFRQKLKYGWWAFSIGERSTARSYGLEAILRATAQRRRLETAGLHISQAIAETELMRIRLITSALSWPLRHSGGAQRTVLRRSDVVGHGMIDIVAVGGAMLRENNWRTMLCVWRGR